MNSEPDDRTTVPLSNAEGEARIGTAVKWTLGSLAAALFAGFIWWNVSSVLNRGESAIPFTRPPIVLPAVPETPIDQPPQLKFVDITEASGLTAVVPNGATGAMMLPETVSGGSAVFDVDGDGDCDILLIGQAPWSDGAADILTLKLYVNDGHARFTDDTEAAGLQLSGHFMAAAAGDVNGDGAIDLFLSGIGENRLLVQKEGRFEDATATAGIRQTIDTAVPPRETSSANSVGPTGESIPPIPQPQMAWGTSCGFWDYDRDGDLDLFVSNYVMWSPEIDQELDCTTTGTGRGYCPPEAFTGSHPFLYRNDGQGRFTEVSAEAGLVARQPDTGELLGKSLSFAICDLNFDGWLDLLVANDSTQNAAFLNQKDGTFLEIGVESGWGFDSAGSVRRMFGMDAAWLADSGVWAIAAGTPTGEAIALYRMAPDLLQFNDDAALLGLGAPSTLPHSIAPLFCDFDLDGRLDLLLGNGGWEPDLVKLRSSQTPAQSPSLFWNNGGDRFLLLESDVIGDDFLKPIRARSMSIADFDGDADPDILIVANGGFPRLLRNDCADGHHWLRIELAGADTVGTRVEVVVGSRRQQWLAVPHRGYLGQSELAITFGLGNAEEADELVIHWPDGTTDRQTSVKSRQILQLDRKKAEGLSATPRRNAARAETNK